MRLDPRHWFVDMHLSGGSGGRAKGRGRRSQGCLGEGALGLDVLTTASARLSKLSSVGGGGGADRADGTVRAATGAFGSGPYPVRRC